MHAKLPEWELQYPASNAKKLVQHVKTIARNLIPCHTVKITIQIQHFVQN